MHNGDDCESYLRSKALLFPDPEPIPFITISIDEMFSGKEVKFYRFKAYGQCIAICERNNLFERMQKIKKLYNEKGKAVVFV